MTVLESVQGWVQGFYDSVDFGHLMVVLGTYVAVYGLAFLGARFVISLRSGNRPTIDQVAHRSLLMFFLLSTTFPACYAWTAWSAERTTHAIPFVIIVLINVTILANLFGKTRARA